MYTNNSFSILSPFFLFHNYNTKNEKRLFFKKGLFEKYYLYLVKTREEERKKGRGKMGKKHTH